MPDHARAKALVFTGPVTYYYTIDHLGSPQLVTDTAGVVVWQGEYQPFGGIDLTVGDVANNIRFPGQYFDGESGLHYNWNRFYDPASGRYISADPIGLAGGINLYAYVEGNPITWLDSSGLLRSDIDYVSSYIGANYPNYYFAGAKIICEDNADTRSGGAYADYPNIIVLPKKYCEECLSDEELISLLGAVVHEFQHLDDLSMFDNWFQREIYRQDMDHQASGNGKFKPGIWTYRHKQIYFNSAKVELDAEGTSFVNDRDNDCCDQ